MTNDKKISYADSPIELSSLFLQDCFENSDCREKFLNLAKVEGRRVLALIPCAVGEYVCRDYFSAKIPCDDICYEHCGELFDEIFSKLQNFEYHKVDTDWASIVLNGIPDFYNKNFDDLMDAAGMFILETMSNAESTAWFLSLAKEAEISLIGVFDYLFYAIHALDFYSFQGQKSDYDTIAASMEKDIKKNLC